MSETNPAIAPRSGVLLVTGYGIRISVERGHLCIEDGIGANRRHARFPRPIRDLQRLVVLGHSGTISLDALLWLSETGAGFVQIHTDGRVISARYDQFPRLVGSTEEQRANWEIIGRGVGIRWPDLDEDLSTDGLLRAAVSVSGRAESRSAT